ncbi:lysophospholipase catalytic domain-containing protein [Aspergillus navahoensis]
MSFNSAALLTAAGLIGATSLVDITLRALPNAPNGYAPANVTCPAVGLSIRSAASLSPNETAWLESRRKEVVSPTKDLLAQLNVTNFDAAAYLDLASSNTSNIFAGPDKHFQLLSTAEYWSDLEEPRAHIRAQLELDRRRQWDRLPAVPDSNTFINLGLNNQSTFFGRDAKDLTGPAPLVVYLPNASYTHMTITPTCDLRYSYADRDAMILNGYNVATRGNRTEDRQWPMCVGCAIPSRSEDRTRTALPDVCTRGFQSYCWNGKLDSRQPKEYAPALMIKTSAAGRISPLGSRCYYWLWMTLM